MSSAQAAHPDAARGRSLAFGVLALLLLAGLAPWFAVDYTSNLRLERSGVTTTGTVVSFTQNSKTGVPLYALVWVGPPVQAQRELAVLDLPTPAIGQAVPVVALPDGSRAVLADAVSSSHALVQLVMSVAAGLAMASASWLSWRSGRRATSNDATRPATNTPGI